MISKLEDALLRCRSDTGNFREMLFRYLDDGVSLLRLRCVSRALYDILDYQRHRVFRQLYIQAPLPESEEIEFLEFVARHCQSLTINVGFMDLSSARSAGRPSSQLSHRSQEIVQSLLQRLNQDRRTDDQTRRDSRNSMPSLRRSLVSMLSTASSPRASISPAQRSFFEQQQFDETESRWIGLLSRFRQISSLTLRIHGDIAWPGRTEIEDTLVNIRVAIEHANIPELRSLNLIPVHAMGIIHLPWSGLHAYGESFASATEVWQRIETLDLRIHNPPALTEKHQAMFYNVLCKYLESFAPSLRCLRLVWLGSEGPSPLALHLEPGIKELRPIRWRSLEELWLGNITHPHQTIRLIPHLAPSVTLAKSLRSTRRDSLAVDANDSSAWMEVLLGAQNLPMEAIVDTSSSIYSRESARSSGPWAGGISRSSREVPLMRDF